MIEFEKVSFSYNQDSHHPVKALEDISLTIGDHEFIGLLGHTGSGKSTLVQHMNGLYFPTSGTVRVNGICTSDENADLRALRQQVGLVFQYPEDQLFEETIYKDIAFGPKNLGLSDEEIDGRVRRSMEMVDMDFEKMKDLSPFDISGGQKRRVAIAGVLALEPAYLVLDEPTAGLDPHGRNEILSEIYRLYQASPKMTIILVTHSMEDIAGLASRLIVIDQGRVTMDGAPREIFSREEDLEAIGLAVPQITKIMRLLKAGGLPVDEKSLTVEEAAESLKKALGPVQNSGAASLPGNFSLNQAANLAGNPAVTNFRKEAAHE